MKKEFLWKGRTMKMYQKLKQYALEKIGYAYLSIFLSFLASLFLLLPYWLFWKFLKELVLFQNTQNVEYYAKRIRSEEHTSELQSRQYLVCRLLLEKKRD